MGYKKVKTLSAAKRDSKGNVINTADGKAIWINCGSILKDENGKLMIVLDAIPISCLGHGALAINVFDFKKKEEPKEVAADDLGF